MYFKVSLLLCALHFFTAAWCMLSEYDINQVVGLFEMNGRGENEIPELIAMQYLLDLGYKKLITIFPSEKSVVNDKTMPDFLICVTDLVKVSDDWQKKYLTTFEVKLFTKIFQLKDEEGVHDGLLTHGELVNLIDVDLNLEPDVKEKIKNEFNIEDSINVLKFLATILEHKPEGKGLDKRHIKKFIVLYISYRGNRLTNKLKHLIQTLHIVSKDYVWLLKFEDFQLSALGLQEFLVFWSDYNKKVNKNSPFFSGRDVRDIIYEFSTHDRNNDGVLDISELEPIARVYFPWMDPVAVMKKNIDPFLKIFKCNRLHSPIKNRQLSSNDVMNAAMFLYMKYRLCFEHKNKKCI